MLLNKFNFILLLACGLVFCTMSCLQKDHATLVADGLASGKRNDDLFLAMRFGQPRQSFYEQCMKLNQEGVIFNGPRNMTAMFTLAEPKETPVDLNFYPDFCDNKICRMRCTFNFQSWAPWAKDFHSKAVLPIAIKWTEDKFQTKLTKMKDEKGKTRMIAIDGNREIRIWIPDDQFVNLFITDLSAKQEEPVINTDTTQQRAVWQK